MGTHNVVVYNLFESCKKPASVDVLIKKYLKKISTYLFHDATLQSDGSVMAGCIGGMK